MHRIQRPSIARLKTCSSLALGMLLSFATPALARPGFSSYEIEGRGAEIMFCDLDGDHFKDVVLIDGLDLSIFYQDAKQGFTRKPQQRHRLEDRPAAIWPARHGRNGESLLVMTSDGVTELNFTNRVGPPSSEKIIKERTILPETLEESRALYFPLSVTAGNAREWPLLLVPVAEGLQVWQHGPSWRLAQTLDKAVDSHLVPSVSNPGYTRWSGLSLSLEDVNGDGREDLIVMRTIAPGIQTYSLHLQKPDGLFAPETALNYTNKEDGRTALCWVDINRDGRLDLIKSSLLEDPFFVPGMRSGKVLVGTYLADGTGRIPDSPRQIFRKNDWMAALPVLDVDGDGFVDLVLGYIPLDTREGLRKMIMTEQVGLSLKFHFHQAAGGFSVEPDCQRNLLIHFDREFFSSSDRGFYYEQFINLNGDFNGDGKKDLLVRDHSNVISVYYFISREKGFSPEADLKFRCPEAIDWSEVADLNGDGLSDLVVKIRKQNAFRIFISEAK